MDIYYNPLDLQCKSITGGIKQNQKLILNIFGKSNEPCLFILQKDEHEAQYLRMHNTADGWQIELNFDAPGLYFYNFLIGGKLAGADEYRNLSFVKNATRYQILVYSEDFATPEWFKGGIMYQIFPDRFYKKGNVTVEEGKWLHEDWNDLPVFRPNDHGKVLNNDFFGGNLQGIIAKLDYLKSLNVSVLYLNPIFKAFSNHRYDTGDYMQIDPMLGTEKDFSQLVEECNKRGMKIVLDGVFNHTGDDSRYFNKYGKYDSVGAYQSKDSKYYAWYNFKHFPDSYDSWWGIDVLPAVNEQCPSYVDFITGEEGVLRHWLKYGIGGYRLDVADELPDDFIEKIRFSVKQENPESIIIGEVWEDASNKIAYSKRRKYFQGAELDSVMNYPLKDAIIHFVTESNSSMLRQVIAQLRDNYPKIVLDSLMNILGTHDTVRILTALSGITACTKEEMSKTSLSPEQREFAKSRLKVAALLQYTLFGVPCVYYGDEIGMDGFSDPFCRRAFTWGAINLDLLSYYRRLGQIRSGCTVFTDGEYKELFADKCCLIFERRKGKEVVVVCINLGSNRYDLKYCGKLHDLLQGDTYLNKFTVFSGCATILSNRII